MYYDTSYAAAPRVLNAYLLRHPVRTARILSYTHPYYCYYGARSFVIIVPVKDIIITIITSDNGIILQRSATDGGADGAAVYVILQLRRRVVAERSGFSFDRTSIPCCRF